MKYSFNYSPNEEQKEGKTGFNKEGKYEKLIFQFKMQPDGSAIPTLFQGTYLGYTTFIGKDGLKVVKCHKFAFPECSTQEFSLGKGAYYCGTSRFNFRTKDHNWKKGQIIQIRHKPKKSVDVAVTQKNTSGKIEVEDYDFWDSPEQDKFNLDWQSFDSEAINFFCGEIDMKAEFDRLSLLRSEKPVDTSAQFSVPVKLTSPDLRPAGPYSHAPQGAAVNYEAIDIPMPRGQPFYTAAEKWAMIDAAAKAALGPSSNMAQVIDYVTSKTGLPVMEQNYDAIISKLK